MATGNPYALNPPEKDPCAPLRSGRYPARRTRSYPPHDGFPTLRNDPAGQPNPTDATTASPPQNVTPPSERIHKDRLFLDLTHDLVDRILTAGHLHRQGGTNLGASTACPAQRPIRDDTRLRQGQRPGGAYIHAGPATYALLSRIQLLRPGPRCLPGYGTIRRQAGIPS